MAADLPVEDPEAGFADYADAVPDGDLVVGHSLGGVTASIVAARRGCPVVYVAALLPQAGVALKDRLGELVCAGMRFERHGGLDFFEAGDARARGLDPALMRGQAPRPWSEVLDDPAPGRYLGCRRDRVVRPEYQAEHADAWLECGHLPQSECPAALAALL